MPFYIMTLVSSVDEQGRPQSATMQGSKDIRDIHVWDERNHAQLHTAFAREQKLTLTRLGFQQSAGRPLERRGEITVFFPFLAAIEDDVKHNLKQPSGPMDFLLRSPKEPFS